MSQFAIRHIEYDSIADFGPIGIAWQEYKLRISVDKVFDEPWAGNTIYFNFLASDPFHKLDFRSWQRGFGMRLWLPYFTARTKSLHVSPPSASARVLAAS